jgi:hypothetical protein
VKLIASIRYAPANSSREFLGNDLAYGTATMAVFLRATPDNRSFPGPVSNFKFPIPTFAILVPLPTI